MASDDEVKGPFQLANDSDEFSKESNERYDEIHNFLCEQHYPKDLCTGSALLFLALDALNNVKTPFADIQSAVEKFYKHITATRES